MAVKPIPAAVVVVVSTGTALAANVSTTLTAPTVDFTQTFEGVLTFQVVFGTVAATAGVRFDVLCYVSGLGTSTPAHTSVTAPATSSTTWVSDGIPLGPGLYTIKVTNLDATNGVTYGITSSGTFQVG